MLLAHVALVSTVIQLAAGGVQSFPRLPYCLLCLNSLEFYLGLWVGRTDPVPFGSSCEVYALQYVILSNTRLKCRAPECYSWPSSRHQELLPCYHLLLGWMLEQSACLGLAALVPNEQLKLRRKGKTGTCSFLLSLLEITAATVEWLYFLQEFLPDLSELLTTVWLCSYSPSCLCTQHLHQ